jgi:penicillin-binding protein 1A
MKRLARIVRFSFVSLLALSLLGVIGAGAAYLVLAPSLPPVKTLHSVEYHVPLRIYAADGTLIAEFGERRREPVTFEEVPKQLIQAFIAAEDQRFYEHPGVDYQGILRAVWYLVRTGEKGPGGSTITMQVARNFFLTPEQTYIRKAREILLALKIERELTKEEILELYVNEIYLGQRAYGVAAAAHIYYGRDLDELTLAQYAMIAGLPKAPSTANPIANPERALARRAYVLRRMHEQGFITDEEYQRASAAPITAQRNWARAEVEAPWVAEMVRREIIDRFGEKVAYTGGLEVYTTIQPERQAAANAAVREALHAYDERHGWRGPVTTLEISDPEDLQMLRKALSEVPTVNPLVNALVLEVDTEGALLLVAGRPETMRLPQSAMAWAGDTPAEVLSSGDVVRLRETGEGPRLAQVPEVQGALVSLDPRDGSIVALTGGYDFQLSKFNRVVQAERQPGSSFKPFIYSAALENGLTPASLVNDAPVVFEDAALESVWRPENYSGRFFGPTRLREALVNSRNLVSIRVLNQIGVDAAIEHLARFGFDPSELPRNLSLALGSATVTPLQMARGFAVFANGGYLVEPWYMERVIDTTANEVLFEAVPLTVCEECVAEASADGDPEPVATEGVVTSAVSNPLEFRSAPRVLPADNAYIMTTMLRDVVSDGTGRRAMSLGRSDLAGKTGTTNDQKDAWFVGFNHALVTAVWVGYDQLQPLGNGETGSRAALPMWVNYMGDALEGVPERPLQRPPGVVAVRIDRETGLVTSADDPDAMFEVFRAGTVPRAELSAGGGGGGGDGQTSGVPERSLF